MYNLVECSYNAFTISSNAYSVSLPYTDFDLFELISLSLLINFYECIKIFCISRR